MHECDAPLQIDGSFTPSEVRIEGGRDVELQVVAGAPLLLRLLPGAPPVRLVGLQLEGLVIANGSRLEASDSTFRGGITVVGAADVLLRDRTLLLSGEVAPAVRLRDGARLRYRLPALKGRWIFAPGGDEQELTEDVDGDFPFACAPGVSGSSDDMEKQNGPQCSGLCPAGFMCPGATGEPRPCSAGGYCSGGDPLAERCPPGTYSADEGLTSSNECTRCGPGSYCPSGSVAPLPCGAGTFSAEGGLGECTTCPSGSFQSAKGTAACDACEAGGYCEKGAVAVTPCAAGTSSAAVNASSATTCTLAPPGFYSTTGASGPSSCGAGTFAPSEGSPECTPCAAGSFQSAKGATSCDACEAGGYCEEGAVAVTPCAAGTSSAVVNLSLIHI